MTRYLSVAILTLFVAAPAWAGDGGKKLTLRWHGQSFFELETSQGTRVVFDPHAIEAYGRTGVKDVDLVLISHNHNDHTQVEVLEGKNKKIILGLKGSGKKVDWNGVDEQFRDVHVYSVGVYHDNAQGMERGKNAVFVLEVDGLRIVHLGDLGHFLSEEQIKRIGPVDVLMIPVGGVYTLNGTEAKKVVEQLKPRMYVIPMHYGTKVYDDVLPVDEFLEDQPKENIQILARTNRLVIDTVFKPKQPVIVVLNWK